jgi:hypothetical protein
MGAALLALIGSIYADRARSESSMLDGYSIAIRQSGRRTGQDRTDFALNSSNHSHASTTLSLHPSTSLTPSQYLSLISIPHPITVTLPHHLGEAVTDLMSIAKDLTKMIYGALEVNKLCQQSQAQMSNEEGGILDEPLFHFLILLCLVTSSTELCHIITVESTSRMSSFSSYVYMNEAKETKHLLSL